MSKKPTLEEFLAGAPLEYPAAKKGKTCTATLQDPTTVAVCDVKGVVTFASIQEGTGENLYYNLTRGS